MELNTATRHLPMTSEPISFDRQFMPPEMVLSIPENGFELNISRTVHISQSSAADAPLLLVAAL